MGKSDVKIVLNREGVGNLLKSAEIQQVLKREAGGIAERGGGDETEIYVASSRAVAQVSTRRNKGNKLLKALRQ